MLIVCPACNSRYELDAAKIGPSGRKVRCAACQTAWQVDPPQAAPEPEPAAEMDEQAFPSPPDEAETAAMLAEELRQAAEIDETLTKLVVERADAAAAPDETPPPVRKAARGRSKAARSADTRTRKAVPPRPAIVALAGLAVLGLALWQRERVVRAAPQFAGLYERLGLPVNIRGLAFSAVESDLVQDVQGRFLVVEGDVTNIARTRTKLPPISVSVRDEAGKVLYTWTTQPPRPELEPAELVRFRARLASPPAEGRSIQVRFAADTGGTAGGVH